MRATTAAPLLALAVALPAGAQPQLTLGLAELTTENGLLRALGSEGDGHLGVPVAGGFDTDGDGHVDVAFSAMTASPSGRGAGSVFLVFGDGTLGGTHPTAGVHENVLKLIGAGSAEAAGSELWMDDVTGDGLGDLLIARQNFDPGGRPGAGALTLVVGGPELRAFDESSPVDLALSPATLPLTIASFVGPHDVSRLGIWMRTGDVDGDGITDLVTNEMQGNGAFVDTGNLIVVSGPLFGVLPLPTASAWGRGCLAALAVLAVLAALAGLARRRGTGDRGPGVSRTARCVARLLAAAWLAAAPAGAQTFLEGRVVRVLDGDTIDVRVGSRTHRIRLLGIDTPERGQPWAGRAHRALRRRVAGREVRVNAVATDGYGRTVGEVYAEGVCVGCELVRDGHGWVYRRFSRDPVLLQLEADAREHGRGLWGLPEAQRVPPWEWRHRDRGGETPAARGTRPADPRCGARRTCGEMASCAEARFHLRVCGLGRLDGDGDGVPCEALCRAER